MDFSNIDELMFKAEIYVETCSLFELGVDIEIFYRTKEENFGTWIPSGNVIIAAADRSS